MDSGADPKSRSAAAATTPSGGGPRLLGRGTKVQTPWLPTYSEVRCLLAVWDNVAQDSVRAMIQAIHAQMGTPQSPVDWTDPDAWIQERLGGTDAELAQRIWQESGKRVNPRHVYGSYLFVNTFDLLVVDDSGQFHVGDAGRAFMAGDASIERALDEAEGIPELLAIIAAKAPARRGDLIAEWTDFLLQASTYAAESTAQTTLRRRLVNTVDRGLVVREGLTYSLTPAGEELLASTTARVVDVHARARGAVRDANDAELARLRELLAEMHPYAFEELIRSLLEKMGYEDVEVTRQSGDKGVDVVGRVQFGITSVTEVVQVKRHRSNIQRPTLDQLRGVLPYHQALRGTIITLGGFSRGCVEAATFTGAAPITLIDGDRLIGLLVEHGIGVRKKSLYLLEVNEDELLASPATEQVPSAKDL